MEITGKWKIAEAELGGKALPVAAFENMMLDIDETSYQLIEKEVIDSGMIELVPDSDPKALNIISLFGPNKGKTFKCIYKFDGKDMITCYNLGGESYPSSFETFENTLLYLVRYKRAD
ncbi:MAG TPA: TIGR03067 domain-containing protein [Puia sp.]|nr:TIGR03067 domain-containing protein [Puia sp.]